MQRDVFGLSDLEREAKKLLTASQGRRIWLWEGEMGAGKTTMIKAVCRELGVQENMASPTFSIVNEYKIGGNDKVYHFDFYRVKNENEALDIGVEEYLDSGAYCFLEWPDRVADLIEQSYFLVRIFHDTDSSRTLEYYIHD